MDRDLALQLIDLLGYIKTAIETIATNTTPTTPEDGGGSDGGGDPSVV